MTQHTFHPDSHREGLADGCPRCAEHAADPLAGLDREMVERLHERIVMGWPGRSDNERLAMANLRAATP